VSSEQLPDRLPESRTPRGRAPVPLVRMRDLRRSAAFNRFRDAGDDPVAAWRKVLQGPWGFPNTRGRSLTDERVVASLRTHLRLVAPEELEQTRHLVRSSLRRTAIAAASLIDGAVRGDFGTVTLIDPDTGLPREVSAPPEFARLKLAAGKLALEASSVVEKRPTVAVQVNNTFGDLIKSPG
jgi:hypothetical protein